MNYHNRRFRAVQNSNNGETSEETVFHYQQNGNTVTAIYEGGEIKEGHLIGLVDDQGIITLSYHHLNRQGEIMTGTCTSTPEIREDGKIRLIEEWQWTSGDKSKGQSIIEEI